MDDGMIYNLLRNGKYKFDMIHNWEKQRKLLFIKRLKNKYKRMKKYPNTIQMPITYLCNFDCVMCGMHHMVNKKDLTPEEIDTILSDKLFQRITSVGINGGEPFLRKDIVSCIDVMIKRLPGIKTFYFISNGYFTERILDHLGKIKLLCGKNGTKVNLSVSVDGIADMQDFHRGKRNAFLNAGNTIHALLENKAAYVDDLDIICTITRYNIERINEVDVWADRIGVNVAYNIATENERIENKDKVRDFSLLNDDHARMLAQEFFYGKYMETGSEKYFALYLYLLTGKRYANCPCMYNEWITLTPDSQIGFCATHSKNLGSALTASAYDLVSDNQEYLEELKSKYCKACSHYMYSLNAEGLELMFRDRNKSKFMR